ncbi:hypothetical protein BGZ89_001855 [Linnemannia elongata]|nr:hypothetical protein BGZ89_001855 [Linnemannia elongata]
MLEMLEEAGFEVMGVDYSTRLASAMFEKQSGKAIVKYLHLKDKATWKAEYFGPEPEVRLLREASPLTRSGTFFQFLHRSMLEYFFSCAVVGPSATERADECSSKPTSDASEAQVLNPDCPLFKRNLLEEPAVIQFLSERVQKNPVFKDQLFEVIKRSKTDASIAITYAAVNAITILVRAGVNFHRYDFRGVRIPGADLSGGQFDSALFQGADLTNVNLGVSWLRNADLSNAQMEGVRFGELPYLEEAVGSWTCWYSPQEKMLAVGLEDGELALYDTSTWKKIRSLSGHSGALRCLKFSSDCQRLVSGSEDHTVRVWDCSSGDLLATMCGHEENLSSLAISPCGKYVASSSDDGVVRLWDSVTGVALFVLEDHTDSVNTVKFSPDGRLLAACGDDETVRFWNVETGEPGDVWELGLGYVMSMEYSPDGREVITGHRDGNLRFWNAKSRSPGPVLRGHTDNVMCISFSPDGQRIASASGDSTIRLWDASAYTLISMYSTSSAVFDVSFSSDGLTLALADGSKNIRIWDGSSNGSSVGQPGHSSAIMSVAYLPTGESILSGSVDKTVRQWDSRTGALESTYALTIPLSKTVFLHELSPDLQKTAYCFDETMEVQDFRTGVVNLYLEGHTKASDAASDAGPDAESDAVPDAEPEEDEPDAESEKPEPDAEIEDDDPDAESDDELVSPTALTFMSTGLRLAFGLNDGTLYIYDTQSKELSATTSMVDLASIEGLGVFALAYSPNDQELAIGCTEGVVVFWDPQSDKPCHTLKVGTAAVRCFAYSPWDDWFAVGGEDMNVHLCRRRQSQSESSDMEPSWCVVSVVEGFLDWIRAIDWNPVVQNEFVTGCQDRSVRVWRILEGEDGGDGSVSVELVWGSNIGMLGAVGMRLDGVVGLDAGNRRLLKQRGAVGDFLTS